MPRTESISEYHSQVEWRRTALAPSHLLVCEVCEKSPAVPVFAIPRGPLESSGGSVDRQMNLRFRLRQQDSTSPPWSRTDRAGSLISVADRNTAHYGGFIAHISSPFLSRDRKGAVV